MMYRCIDQLQKKANNIASLCRLLEVSRSGYYAARMRARRPKKVCPTSIHLQAAFDSSGRCYGSRRLRMALQAKGYSVGRYRIRKLMRINGLRPVWKRKFIHTTDSNHDLPTAANVLDRQFAPATVNAAWVSDITYIRTIEGFLYLTIVLDLYDRKVIGWSLYDEMSTEKTSLSAWKVALANRKIEKGLIFHSDRGVQYANNKFANMLESHHVIRSMSRKGNCWDNAVAESFFKTLKTELIYGNKLINKQQMELEIFQYIEIFYNKKRRHSALNYKTIEEFNQQKISYKNVA